MYYQRSMRGADQNQGLIYSYVAMERRIRVDHPARKVRVLVDRALKSMDPLLEYDVCVFRAPIDCAGASFTGAASDDFVFDSIGASVNGAIGLQPVVPVVCGS